MPVTTHNLLTARVIENDAQPLRIKAAILDRSPLWNVTWWRGDEVYEINAEFTEMCLVIYLSRSLDSSVYDCRQPLRAFFHCAVSAADEATSWSSQ